MLQTGVEHFANKSWTRIRKALVRS